VLRYNRIVLMRIRPVLFNRNNDEPRPKNEGHSKIRFQHRHEKREMLLRALPLFSYQVAKGLKEPSRDFESDEFIGSSFSFSDAPLP
jgi:hypothetical protein